MNKFSSVQEFQTPLDEMKAPKEAQIKWALMLIAFIDAIGRGLFLAGATFFYTQVVKLSNDQVGMGLSLAGLVGLACAIPIGRLADRYGAGRILTGIQIWRAVGFLIYPFVTNFHVFLIVAGFIGAVELAIWPLLQTIAGSVAHDDSYVKTISKVSVIRNVAYTLSAGIVALIIGMSGSESSIQWLLVANAIAFLVSAAVLVIFPIPKQNQETVKKKNTGSFFTNISSFKDKKFLLLSLLNGVLSLHAATMNIALPLWMLTKTSVPKSFVAILLAVNTILTIALQLRFSRGGDDLFCAGRKQLYAGLSLVSFCLLVSQSDNSNMFIACGLLLFGTIILTFGELWQSAGSWGISFCLSPSYNRAYYLSIYSLGTSVMSIIGPWLLSAVVVENGFIGWTTLATLYFISGISVWLVVRKSARDLVSSTT